MVFPLFLAEYKILNKKSSYDGDAISAFQMSKKGCLTKEVTYKCFVKSCYGKFRKIHRKAPAMESIFSKVKDLGQVPWSSYEQVLHILHLSVIFHVNMKI